MTEFLPQMFFSILRIYVIIPTKYAFALFFNILRSSSDEGGLFDVLQPTYEVSASLLSDLHTEKNLVLI